jgi:hypothetical protein
MNDAVASRADAQRYFSLAEDHLFSLIPRYLPEYEGVNFSGDSEVNAGRNFFEDNLPALHGLVCIQWGYCNRRHDPDLQDAVTLVMSVGDVIAGYCGSIPPFVISALLVKKSLNAICQCK